MSSEKAYRSATLYVTHQVHRWLSWLCIDEAKTADILAEEILRTAILKNYPTIEEAESRYQAGRKKLNEEAKAMLKGNPA